MIKKIFFTSALFISLLYYLNKEGYIIITEKSKKKIDQEWGKVKKEGKNVVKKGVRSALVKGQELLDETWIEYKEEFIHKP